MTALATILRHVPRTMAAITAVLMAAFAWAALFCGGAALAAWPDRNITIIVPFPAGGATDLVGRLLAAELSPMLGCRVAVENRVGDVGNVGIGAAARAASTGYTLIVVTNAMLINPAINPGLTGSSYDPLRDFSPIAYLGAAPNIIITRPDSGITSIADLIAKAKAAPGSLTYASPGIGSSSALAMELFKLRAKVDIRPIGFDGSEPALMAVLSGATDVAVVGIAGLLDRIHSGVFEPLALTGAERWPDLADVPTLAEAGISGAEAETTQMFLAPAGTPEPIIQRLAHATEGVLQRPEIKAAMLKAGFRLQYEGPDELHDRILREVPLWDDVVTTAGLRRK